LFEAGVFRLIEAAAGQGVGEALHRGGLLLAGFDENGIWVDRGCRAEFVLGGEARFTPRGTSDVRVVCESQNEAMTRCAADTYYGVVLARQISNSMCLRGESWGYDASGIWVTRGCRAEFVLGY
jgi:hypothetical protein